MPKINPVEASSAVSPSEVVKPVAHPYYYSPYYSDNRGPSDEDKAIITASLGVSSKTSSSQFVGWSSADTIAPASPIDSITKVSKRPQPVMETAPSEKPTLTLSSENIEYDEFMDMLEEAYEKISPEARAQADAEVTVAASMGRQHNKIDHHMGVMSKRIDEALTLGNMEYEAFHALVLKFCMLFMRKVAKDDQEYISKISEQITIKVGQIKDTHNTWPVVAITLGGSLVGVIAGSGGLAHHYIPTWTFGKVLADHAQSIGSASTAISGLEKVFSPDGLRGLLQHEKQTLDHKKEEKTGAKRDTNETKKRHYEAVQQILRDHHAVIQAMLDVK